MSEMNFVAIYVYFIGPGAFLSSSTLSRGEQFPLSLMGTSLFQSTTNYALMLWRQTSLTFESIW